MSIFFFYKDEFWNVLSFKCYTTMDEIRKKILTECKVFLNLLVDMHIEIIEMCSERTIAIYYYRTALGLIEVYAEKKIKIEPLYVNYF